MEIGKIVREIEVLPDEEVPQVPEDQPSVPEPTRPESARSLVSA
jgi:hypothetical protein